MLTKPKKSLSQNFLIDKNILQKIVNAVPIYKNNEILEQKKQAEFSEKIDELNQETDTLLEEVDKWQI